jgi:hypothetical protein
VGSPESVGTTSNSGCPLTNSAVQSRISLGGSNLQQPHADGSFCQPVNNVFTYFTIRRDRGPFVINASIQLCDKWDGIHKILTVINWIKFIEGEQWRRRRIELNWMEFTYFSVSSRYSATLQAKSTRWLTIS